MFMSCDRNLPMVLFRIKLVRSVDGNWGAIENGSMNGMVGMVARKVTKGSFYKIESKEHVQFIINFIKLFGFSFQCFMF